MKVGLRLVYSMTSLKRATKWYLISGLLALTLMICWTACVSSTPTSTPTQTVPTSTPTQTMPTSTPTHAVPTSTPTQTVPKEMVESVIRGQGIAIQVSDVSSFPDFVITQGEVLFIPEEHAEDLVEMAGFDPSKMNYMQKMEYISHALFQLDEPQFSGATQILAAQVLLNFLGFIFHARGAR